MVLWGSGPVREPLCLAIDGHINDGLEEHGKGPSVLAAAWRTLRGTKGFGWCF